MQIENVGVEILEKKTEKKEKKNKSLTRAAYLTNNETLNTG